ncbi:MAG: gamma-glutamyltransferase [Gemmatimonadales bacterium]
MIPLIAFAALTLFAQQGVGASDPAYSPDGRLAVAIRGDIWIQHDEQWTQVTSGQAIDHEPAWAPAGEIVFSSDRAGVFDLWRVTPGTTPIRITTSPEDDAEPTVRPDGTIFFVRGSGVTARIWKRDLDGAENRVTESKTPERWPAVSADGRTIAYVAIAEGPDQLHVRWFDGDSSKTITARDGIEHPAWSPDGTRLTFTTRSGNAGVWITPIDGSYTNLVTPRVAATAWQPGQERMVLVELPPPELGYNGDPDRVGDRATSTELPTFGQIWSVNAPPGIDFGLSEIAVAVGDRATLNAQAFDRMWERTTRLYYDRPGAEDARELWSELRTKYRRQALGAPDDRALSAVIHSMLQERPPYAASATGRAAVSSAHPVATAAGVEMLERGGNVVDAAVAVSFALGVVEPDASGIGGYGQMLIYDPKMAEPKLIEFMTRAPEESSLLLGGYLENGRYPPDGPVLANVPGTVAGMYLAWQKYGSGDVDWADVLAPAIRAANGYEVSDGLATTLSLERDHYLKYDGPTALFFRDGEPLVAGDTVVNTDLAWTLEQIAEDGVDAFYRGEVGRRMVADLRGQGNAIRTTDLQRYWAVEREPIGTTYRGYSIFGSAPPTSGGATISAQLNNLENASDIQNYTKDAGSLHAMIEAWKLVPSRRGRIADPGLWPVNTEAHTSKDSARARWKCFDADHSMTPDEAGRNSAGCVDDETAGGSFDAAALEVYELCAGDLLTEHFCHFSGTTSFAVADGDGNMVAVTQTLGTWGGNFYVTPGLGFIYNDKLRSYSSDPESYGARVANARHGSSISPTLVLKGTGDEKEAFLATGAAGNSWITSAVYSIVTGMIDGALGPQAAIELPRFLLSRRQVQGELDYVVLIEQGVPPSVIDGLESRGHTIQFISLPGELRMGYGSAVMVKDGRATAAADPRRSGTAGSVP